MNGLCTPLSPSQQEHSRPRGMCGTGVCRKKAPPGKKPVAEHATLLRRRLQRKKSPQAPLPPPEARGMRVSAGKNSRIQVAETFLCPERRKTSRGSPTAQGKNWLWKRKLTRCAGSPTTPERKNALPVPHGRREGDFPSFCVMPPAGGTPKSGRLFRQTHSAPGKTPPRQEIGRPHLPAESFTPQESPQDKTGEGKFPSGGCARPSLCSKSLRPGLRPHDRKPTPPRPEHQQNHSGRAQIHGEQIPPFPTEKHVPPGSECCVCALLPRENAFLRFPAGKAAAFSPCLREENKKKPCRRTKCALKLQGFKRRKAPETGAFPKITLASAYFPTQIYAVSWAMRRLTSEFGMGSGVPASLWTPANMETADAVIVASGVYTEKPCLWQAFFRPPPCARAKNMRRNIRQGRERTLL